MLVMSLALLTLPVDVLAHEGHAHKIMGTVAARHETHLEVKGTDGKASTIRLNEKTKVLRGTTAVTPEDIKPGERVVVTTTETKGKDGRPIVVATQIKLAPASK
jgi:Mg-chelatase subunit ChlI